MKQPHIDQIAQFKQENFSSLVDWLRENEADLLETVKTCDDSDLPLVRGKYVMLQEILDTIDSAAQTIDAANKFSENTGDMF